MTPHQDTLGIITATALPYGFTLSDMLSHARNRPVRVIRQAAYSRVERERPLMSLTQMGRLFNKDHSSVLHGIQMHEARMAWVEVLMFAGNPDGQMDLFNEAA